jgi:hypothetical protein
MTTSSWPPAAGPVRRRAAASDPSRTAGPQAQVPPPRAANAADWLEVVLPRLPNCLASNRAVARLRALARQLPGDGPIVLETHLTPSAGGVRPVDLSLQVSAPAQAAALCGGGEGAAAAGWQLFLRSWAARPAWRARVPSVWLEFDLRRPPGVPGSPGPASALPVPILCAQLAAGVEAGWVAGTLLPAMRAAPLAAAQRRLLERCWREVPAPGRPLYVFALLPRRTSAVRLEIAGGIELPALASFLGRLQAAAAAARVTGLAPLLAEGGRLHLSCDLGESLEPRVGIEVSFPQQPRRDPRWGRLLGRLVATGLCSPAARDAALAWPGQDSLWTAPERWPLGRGAVALRCARALSHVKLVSDRRRPTAAKLYLLAAALGGSPRSVRCDPGSPGALDGGPAQPPGCAGGSLPPAARSSQESASGAASCPTRSR